MKKTFLKNVFRDFAHSPGRFVALFLIITLGALFYTGLRSMSPSMEQTAEQYYERTKLADFRLLSDLGVSREDADSLAGLDGVGAVMPVYSVDALAFTNDSTYAYAVRSLPEDTSSDNPDYLSRVTLEDGRMPEAPDECLADARKLGTEGTLGIGDKVMLADDNTAAVIDMFAETEFTVVGTCYSPSYIAMERGNTTIGTGELDAYLYIPESAFDSEYYTELDLRLTDTEGLSPYASAYGEVIDDFENVLETWTDERAEARRLQWEEEAIDEATKEFALTISGGLSDTLPAGMELPDEVKNEIPKVPTPEWFIFDREANPGYPGFEDNARRIDSISITLTSFLYLVAALVCLTTMTRMVEEQRLTVGAFKALGYRRRSVMFKYFVYALIIGAAGGIVGSAVGYLVLPKIIWNAYTMMYQMDDLAVAVTPRDVIIGVGGGLTATVLATLAASYAEMKETAADLMRPKAPKAGKRVLLERITPLWKRMRFSYKVTARNLFRNKKRMTMTIIGVAGCCALLLTGLGIRDSISSMLDLQYEKITHAQITVYTEDGKAGDDDSELSDLLAGYGKYMYFLDLAIDVSHGKLVNSGMPTKLFVPEDAYELKDFIDLHERKSGEKIAFPPDGYGIGGSEYGAVITEKLANVLEVKLGDMIRIGESGKKKVYVTVTGICENYIFNYVYITPEAYTHLFGKAPVYTSVLLELSEEEAGIADGDYADILRDVVAADGVRSAVSIVQLRETMDNVRKSLDAIVYAILVISGLLALIVLYNLSNINITERERELATLRVLGFRKDEISHYVGRESIILTFFSIAIGLVAGVFLHSYVMHSVEISEVMFGREISAPSFLYAALFTLACSLLMNAFMLPKIMRIDPVSALKSAE